MVAVSPTGRCASVGFNEIPDVGHTTDNWSWGSSTIGWIIDAGLTVGLESGARLAN